MHTEVRTCIQIKLAGVGVQLLAIYSQPASTESFALASNLYYDQLIVLKMFLSVHVSSLIEPCHIQVRSGSDPNCYPGQWVI